MFINPIEILELQQCSVAEIDSSLIKKQKRKFFADIDLSDNEAFDYKGISLNKTDCERAIDDLANSDYVEFYLYLANNNQPLNDFLVNGDESFFEKFPQESIYKLPEFVNFISPYFAARFDKALVISVRSKGLVKTQNILRTQNLINISDKNIAFKSTSIELSDNIKKIENITNKIKNNETSWTAESIPGLLSYVRMWSPVNILNVLPKYFQSQINKTAAAINQLQLAIWDNLYNTSACRQLIEHLLALNVESVGKKTFEDNYKIVKQADERKHIDKLLTLLDSFDSKAKTIANAKELIFQAKPLLFNIKAISKESDNIYISLSTRVASDAQGFVIEEVNLNQSANNQLESILGYPKLKSVLKNAWEVTQLIGSLDLQDDFRINRYNPNKETLQDICGKLSVATPQLVFGKMAKYNFVILDGTIAHTGKDCKSLPITTPFIRGDVRYIGINLKIEAFANQPVKFDLKYIQPNGTVNRGTASPTGYTISSDKTININTQLISFAGWGNSEKGTYEVGTHHIEVWIDNCLIFRKSFVVDFSPEEKRENAKQEAVRREREKIEAERRKEQAKIAEQKAQEKKVRTVCLWIMGIFIVLAIIFAIWGTEGLQVVGGIIGFIAFFGFIGWIQNATKS
jgi:hypothetical protein